ncbi:hypothetical protein QVD17_03689 [Tagetes erecta]|uniref:Uncharacterized protein n=1 Tax=Tagetes erecta TaxID=13708 RepID=A0AAD8LBR9_TARER|nr:hypothetical protein QVD17_03689 [Tagetes erecta]
MSSESLAVRRTVRWLIRKQNEVPWTDLATGFGLESPSAGKWDLNPNRKYKQTKPYRSSSSLFHSTAGPSVFGRKISVF